MRRFFLAVLACTLGSCATGERMGRVEEGMPKNEVRKAMGKEDQIDHLPNGFTAYLYRNRLMSGWSWDKTDYYVVFDPTDKVYSYGHGSIDTSLSERIAIWSAEQARKSQSINCTTTTYGRTAQTNCTTR